MTVPVATGREGAGCPSEHVGQGSEDRTARALQCPPTPAEGHAGSGSGAAGTGPGSLNVHGRLVLLELRAITVVEGAGGARHPSTAR
ncbi:MAG TPA: hypothetical protein VME46_03610 [Acidimicrobiales bacterium]|nr:hypothetical protein [Acidimicrobiales bacterium]